MARTDRHKIFEMSKNKMNKKILVPVVVTATALCSGIATAQSWDGSFSKRVYLGIGAGQSRLVPDTSAVASLDVVEKNDTGSTLTLGFDFSRRMTVELQYADLGTSELTGNDGIEYSEASVSGLYYLWNGLGSADYLDFDGLDQRAGLSLFGRLGVGKMENEAVQTVQFERKNDAQLMIGLGVEYALAMGLGVRAEYINFDTDAKYRGLSVLYRFGGRRGSTTTDTVAGMEKPELPTLPAPQAIETLPPPPPPPPEFLKGIEESTLPEFSETDNDADGVVNEFDECPATPTGTPVSSTGCAMFNGALEGVNFLTGSDTLTGTARTILDDVVNTLDGFPDIRISVEAHTDSRGGEAANLALSRNRALAVVRYLTAQGVPLDRLEARAFGETQPIADNNTRAGRLLNRRVEFRTVQ